MRTLGNVICVIVALFVIFLYASGIFAVIDIVAPGTFVAWTTGAAIAFLISLVVGLFYMWRYRRNA